jgi:hypothetical protein
MVYDVAFPRSCISWHRLARIRLWVSHDPCIHCIRSWIEHARPGGGHIMDVTETSVKCMT